MEQTEVKSTFIPKQAISRQLGREHQPMGLFMLVAIVVLILSGLFAGGVYAYKLILDDEINGECPADSTTLAGCGLEAALKRRSEQLEEDRPSILEFQKLDRKFKRAETLLTAHYTPLPILALLEIETLKTIRYNSFGYTPDGRLRLNGQAKSYESVALQSDEFSRSEFIKNFVFSGLNADATGIVRFDLELEVDPGITSYARYLNP